MDARMCPAVGSAWRKWDLHVHTPASYLWRGSKRFAEMSETEADAACHLIVERMNAAEAAAFAIMDYLSFDGYLRVRTYCRKHPELLQKAVFPGMELRCEAPTEIRLNIHVLLSDELTDQQLLDFRAALEIPLIGRPLSDEALADVARRATPDILRSLGHKHSDHNSFHSRLV